MTKRKEGNYIDFSQLDPAVEELLSDAQARKVQTPAQRKQARKDAQRVRKSFDLPGWLKDQLIEQAAALGVPVSSLAVYLMVKGQGCTSLAELEGARQPTRSMRYEYVLPVETPGKVPDKGMP
jgi:hypothetical protein